MPLNRQAETFARLAGHQSLSASHGHIAVRSGDRSCAGSRPSSGGDGRDAHQLRSRRRAPLATQRVLPLPREVYRFAKDSRRLLWRVKHGGVFRLDEIEVELGHALEVPRSAQLGAAPARRIA
jgi:hypothetical protein